MTMLSDQDTSASWKPGRREQLVDLLKQTTTVWDIVIIGGGITGAGILRECGRRGLKALLLEKHDFSYGSSSKSSKMVHGGLRYLASGQLSLTRDSVRERQRLMTEAEGLVDPLRFVMPHYRGQFPPGFLFERVLDVYDLMAGARQHHRYPARDAVYLAPGIREERLASLSQFTDAVTDDSRLVLRVLHEAHMSGVQSLNYCAVKHVLKSRPSEAGQTRVSGVVAQDMISNQELEIPAKVVINATGAWADELRVAQGEAARMRPLRGSHLVIPGWRFPVGYSVSFFHPHDKRPVFIFPWEGVTVIGTTDLDHHQDMRDDASISQAEVNYLLGGIQHQFPALGLNEDDVISSWSGVRPVVSSGALNPSEEKREHSVWDEKGLITVAGGKLTTFRLIALDVLKHAAKYLENENLGVKGNHSNDESRIFSRVNRGEVLNHLPNGQAGRLVGRFGLAANEIATCEPDQLQPVQGTPACMAELRWSLDNEMVMHLDDLMLRRSRLGLLLPNAGASVLDEVGHLCRSKLGWSESHWADEVRRYEDIYRRHFSLPGAPVDSTEVNDPAGRRQEIPA
ncbi:glycerol-3-phosphate dehydrogenase [Hahella sp. CCB-MM4]|uniref:glycerol-3-phosphate dehydrogenase/oxidase n=1 Tax=Hahella sp. (strain CCB-MM4) TaxID=1926491 RepID=UPI000B9BF67C|nr:glycerol-3-phosphate dehydrogenase/oxidase [Hahella sp. CCB-MM4]OZG73929.1 glycerol-3-phosphate dehydrogenase [Hahella sp. CCB-MM4]